MRSRPRNSMIAAPAFFVVLGLGSRASAVWFRALTDMGLATAGWGRLPGRWPLYNPAFGQPQTTTNYQPLINAITSLPGWYGTGTHHPHHRIHSHPSGSHASASQASPSNAGSLHASGSHAPAFDDNGKIVWPSTIPDDSRQPGCATPAEAAVKDAVHESKLTGSTLGEAGGGRQEQAIGLRGQGAASGQSQEQHRRRGSRELFRRPRQCTRRDDLCVLTPSGISSEERTQLCWVCGYAP